jgi:hypothetical protein
MRPRIAIKTFAALSVLVTSALLLGLSGIAVAQQETNVNDWPVLEIANPGPGALVPSGDIVISGMAFDPAATEGAGVTRVDLFLGDRDQGGLYLGSAVPGQNVMEGLTPGSPVATQSFQVTVLIPSTLSGGTDLRAYAESTLTGKETIVSLPIYLAIAPTPMAMPAPAPVANIEHLGVPGPAAAFSLANPSAGNVVLTGDYIVSGMAGPDVTHVQFFLGERDTGGMILGTVVPEDGKFMATLDIPSTTSGGHDFVAYAYSANTGLESKVSVPIWIGAAPTPTPRPADTP